MSFGICICTQMGKHKCHMQNDLGCRLTHGIIFFSIHLWISTIIWKETSIMWHLNLHGEQFLQISWYLLWKILYSSAKYALAFKVEVMYMILSWYMIYDIWYHHDIMKELTTMYHMTFDVLFTQFEKYVGKMENVTYTFLYQFLKFLKVPWQSH